MQQTESRTILAEFLPVACSLRGTSPFQIGTVSRDNLFGSLSEYLNRLRRGNLHLVSDDNAVFATPIAVVSVTSQLAISFNRLLAKPFLIQCFIWKLCSMELANGSDASARADFTPFQIDDTTELTVWGPASLDAQTAQARWRELTEDGEVDEIESLVTPKLYGSKERITEFIVAVSAAVIQAGTPVLDLMSGTGIVSRKLATRFPVIANDANPYAACLTRSQAATMTDIDFKLILDALRPRYEENLRRIRELVPDMFETEAAFLHGDHNETTLRAYINFSKMPLRLSYPPSPAAPATMMLSSYSNAYFGVQQAAELDAVRAAIDDVAAQNGLTKDFLLAGLIIAACICTTGPHFAQPPGVSSISAFRDIVERRARSVIREFELALRRLMARRISRFPILSVTTLDWRDALARFAHEHPGGAVYVDPPYTRLQYSRYYHVLNTLLSYDYPLLQGKGRYPPRSTRFSSRFESRRGSAEKEFIDLFDRCSSSGLTLLLSYSDRGLVPIDVLIEHVARRFSALEVFSRPIRHHSQGVRLKEDFARVTEFIIVGHHK